MLRMLESVRGQAVKDLMTLSAVGGAAVGGALYEAAHNNITGAVAYMVAGTIAMGATGVFIDKKHTRS